MTNGIKARRGKKPVVVPPPQPLPLDEVLKICIGDNQTLIHEKLCQDYVGTDPSLFITTGEGKYRPAELPPGSRFTEAIENMEHYRDVLISSERERRESMVRWNQACSYSWFSFYYTTWDQSDQEDLNSVPWDVLQYYKDNVTFSKMSMWNWIEARTSKIGNPSLTEKNVKILNAAFLTKDCGNGGRLGCHCARELLFAPDCYLSFPLVSPYLRLDRQYMLRHDYVHVMRCNTSKSDNPSLYLRSMMKKGHRELRYIRMPIGRLSDESTVLAMTFPVCCDTFEKLFVVSAKENEKLFGDHCLHNKKQIPTYAEMHNSLHLDQAEMRGWEELPPLVQTHHYPKIDTEAAKERRKGFGGGKVKNRDRKRVDMGFDFEGIADMGVVTRPQIPTKTSTRKLVLCPGCGGSGNEHSRAIVTCGPCKCYPPTEETRKILDKYKEKKKVKKVMDIKVDIPLGNGTAQTLQFWVDFDYVARWVQCMMKAKEGFQRAPQGAPGEYISVGTQQAAIKGVLKEPGTLQCKLVEGERMMEVVDTWLSQRVKASKLAKRKEVEDKKKIDNTGGWGNRRCGVMKDPRVTWLDLQVIYDDYTGLDAFEIVFGHSPTKDRNKWSICWDAEYATMAKMVATANEDDYLGEEISHKDNPVSWDCAPRSGKFYDGLSETNRKKDDFDDEVPAFFRFREKIPQKGLLGSFIDEFGHEPTRDRNKWSDNYEGEWMALYVLWGEAPEAICKQSIHVTPEMTSKNNEEECDSSGTQETSSNGETSNDEEDEDNEDEDSDKEEEEEEEPTPLQTDDSEEEDELETPSPKLGPRRLHFEF